MLIGYESRPIAAGAGRPVVGTTLEVRRTKFALADADAAGERTGIIVDPVVGDLQEMRPAVDEDAAAALGAVGDTQPIDARRVANVIAGVRVGIGDNPPAVIEGMAQIVVIARQESASCTCTRTRGRARIADHATQQRGADREIGLRGVKRIRSMEIYALRQDGDSRAFEGAHERGLL